MNDNDDVRVWGTAARARTAPRPSVGGEPPLLETDEDPEVHHEALNVLRERHALDDRADLLPQDVYDSAVQEARRRLARGGKTYTADDGTDPIAAVRREFKSDHADGVDEASAIAHLKATTVLAASRRPVTEANYLACLHAVADSAGRRSADSELDKRLEAAEALSDLAQARLAERGIYSSASGYEHVYVLEVSKLADQFGVDMHR